LLTAPTSQAPLRDRSGRQGNLRIAPGTGFWDLMENGGPVFGATWGTADDDAGVRTDRMGWL
jgi:hypothetical protein